jgi:uncharacterized protein YdaU (DUF1376 family)
MKLPFIQFFPADYMRDTRALSLASKGGWMDILCMLHSSSTRGTMTLPVVGWARVMGATVDQATAVISELETMSVAEITREGNGDVTLTSRRMERDAITREQGRLRAERHRRNAARNADSDASVTGQKTETRIQKTETIKEGASAAPPTVPEVSDKGSPLVIPLLLNVPDFLKPWAQWEAVRRKGKKPKTSWEEYFAKQLAFLERMGLEAAIESVEQSARNEWQGLFEPKRAHRTVKPQRKGEFDRAW